MEASEAPAERFRQQTDLCVLGVSGRAARRFAKELILRPICQVTQVYAAAPQLQPELVTAETRDEVAYATGLSVGVDYQFRSPDLDL